MKNKFDIKQFVEVTTPQSMARKLAEKEKISRKKMELTQKELSERLGVSYASVRRFKFHQRKLFVLTIKIANALVVTEDY